MSRTTPEKPLTPEQRKRGKMLALLGDSPSSVANDLGIGLGHAKKAFGPEFSAVRRARKAEAQPPEEPIQREPVRPPHESWPPGSRGSGGYQRGAWRTGGLRP